MTIHKYIFPSKRVEPRGLDLHIGGKEKIGFFLVTLLPIFTHRDL